MNQSFRHVMQITCPQNLSQLYGKFVPTDPCPENWSRQILQTLVIVVVFLPAFIMALRSVSL
jgi:hypothetical protein